MLEMRMCCLLHVYVCGLRTRCTRVREQRCTLHALLRWLDFYRGVCARYIYLIVIRSTYINHYHNRIIYQRNVARRDEMPGTRTPELPGTLAYSWSTEGFMTSVSHHVIHDVILIASS